MKRLTGAAVLLLAVTCAGAEGLGFTGVSGLVTDRGFERGRWRLDGDAVYSTTNCHPVFRQSVIDMAGHALDLKMGDRTWENTTFEGDCTITNGSEAPSRLVMRTVYGKYHVRTREWHGGARNVADVSGGRFYIRTAVDSPDCWTLRLGADGGEEVMGDAVTGPDAGRYLWAGPVEFAGNVLFSDDTNTKQGGWGCTLTGPLSGGPEATVSLGRAFCLRIGSKTSSFAGKWNLRGGGDGTYRCRLDLLKDAAFSGKDIKVCDSDIVMDGATRFALPPIRHVDGDCRLVGGAAGSTLRAVLKQGTGTLTLASPLAVTGTLRLEEGTLSVEKDATGRLPSVARLVCLPGTVIDLHGNDLSVGELQGDPEIRNPGRLTAAKRGALSRKPGKSGPDILARLLELGKSRKVIWAWTEPWTTWGSMTSGDWPRFNSPLGKLTKRAPLMSYYDLGSMMGTWHPDSTFREVRRINAEAIRTHWRACHGIPVFSWHMDHPCTTNGFGQAWYRYKCKEHPHVIADILSGVEYPCGVHMQWTHEKREPCRSPREWYFRRLDDIAAFYNRLVDDDGNRIPVVMRYGHEMDGSWFWWGDKWCTPAEFVALSRMTADYLREKCGKENVLFAYTPDRTWKDLGAEGDGGHNFLSWYPGDAYVDIMGFDDYSIGKGDTDEKADANFNETLRKLRLVCDYARPRGKVVGVTETGCKDARTDFWARLLRLAVSEGVDCAFVDTWGGPWSYPDSDAGIEDQRRFLADPAVLMVDGERLRAAADRWF